MCHPSMELSSREKVAQGRRVQLLAFALAYCMQHARGWEASFVPQPAQRDEDWPASAAPAFLVTEAQPRVAVVETNHLRATSARVDAVRRMGRQCGQWLERRTPHTTPHTTHYTLHTARSCYSVRSGACPATPQRAS